MADPAERSSVAALTTVASQVTGAATPVLGGYLLDEVSLALPLELAAFLQFVNPILFWCFFSRRPLRKKPPSASG